VRGLVSSVLVYSVLVYSVLVYSVLVSRSDVGVLWLHTLQLTQRHQELGDAVTGGLCWIWSVLVYNCRLTG